MMGTTRDLVGPAKQRARVCIVTRHPLVGRYISGLIRRSGRFSVDFCLDVAATDRSREPSVIIVDMAGEALEVATAIHSSKSLFQTARILLIGIDISNEQLSEMFLSGVHGFIAYDQLGAGLVKAIQTVQAGRLSVSPGFLEHFARYVSRTNKNFPSAGALTNREANVLLLVRKGLTNKEVGVSLGISEATVKFHLKNVFEKTGVHDRRRAADLMDCTQLGTSRAARSSAAAPSVTG